MEPRMRLFRFLGTVFLCSVVGLSWAESPAPKAKRYQTKEVHDRFGTGKFYMDREIAQVMSHEGAPWLERPEREKEEEPKKLLKVLDFKPGQVVADIGAGSGYYSFRIAEKVKPRGKVLAVDIQKEMLDIIRARMKRQKVSNIEPILGTETDPKLPEAGVDLILLVDVYHEFSFPFEMSEALVKALKPGGRLVFVEFRKEDPKVPILEVHKMSVKQVLKEMKPLSLKHVKTESSLPWQHVIIFEKLNEKVDEKTKK
jgi:ubiquinone/menaquinone biosynthesis C-methylase UbiE